MLLPVISRQRRGSGRQPSLPASGISVDTEKDSVYAFEAQQKHLAQEQTTALTRYGIYWYAGRGLPERVSWREFLAGELTGETGGEGIELKLNGRPIGEYKNGEKECSVWVSW